MKHLIFILILGTSFTTSLGVSAQDNGESTDIEKKKTPEAETGDDGNVKPNTITDKKEESTSSKTEETTARAKETTTEKDGKATEPTTSASTSEAAEKEEKSEAAAEETKADSTTSTTEVIEKTEEPQASSAEAKKTPRKAGPPAREPHFSLRPPPPYSVQSLQEYRQEYKRNRLMQTMGKSMLLASFAMELIGAVAIEVAPWGPVACSAFGVVGAGIAHFIASAFLLGFSKPLHHLTPPRRQVIATPGTKDILFM